MPLDTDKFIRKITDRYAIYTGVPEQSHDVKANVYKIVNTETNINEGETSIYARAILFCMGFEEDLKSVEASLDSGETIVLEEFDKKYIN